MDQYRTSSTSKITAKVEDRELSKTTTTRKILRPVIVDNPKNEEASLSFSILHQRKNKSQNWEDVPAESLAKLKAGETTKMNFDTSESLSIFQELSRLYQLGSNTDVFYGENDLIVARKDEVVRADPQKIPLIRKLLSEGYSNEFWEQLQQVDPNKATALSLAQLHADRQNVLNEFKLALVAKKDESFWQKFFEANQWIFGYGLHYQFLKSVEIQPLYGGKAVNNRGGQKGDFLAATEGGTRYTVLVEIKTPDTQLLCTKEYRNQVYAPSEELSGGLSQLLGNSWTWETEGSRTDANKELIDDHGIYTFWPKGVLVIGSLSQLTNRNHKGSFERFRRNLHRTEVLTFDELFERARHIVNLGSST